MSKKSKKVLSKNEICKMIASALSCDVDSVDALDYDAPLTRCKEFSFTGLLPGDNLAYCKFINGELTMIIQESPVKILYKKEIVSSHE